METTSPSLIARIRQPGEDVAWSQFVQLYTPLLYFWAKSMGLSGGDAADLVQEVFMVLLNKLEDFEYDAGRSFRGWLRTIMMNKCRDLLRKRARGISEIDPAACDNVGGPDSVSRLADVEYKNHLVERALQLMQNDFQPATWKACWETVVRDRSPAEVAEELGTTINAVYLAKSRVLRHLREELRGMWG